MLRPQSMPVVGFVTRTDAVVYSGLFRRKQSKMKMRKGNKTLSVYRLVEPRKALVNNIILSGTQTLLKWICQFS